jgi:predicted dinucleotide-binding enzyme
MGDRVNTLHTGSRRMQPPRDLVVVATRGRYGRDPRAHAGALDGKVVIAMANGLEGRRIPPSPRGSISEAVRPPHSRHRGVPHVASFAALDVPLESDVVVCSDDDAARDLVFDLVADLPDLRAFDGGSLANAIGIEAFAAVLLSVNLRHKGKGTLRLLGVKGRRERAG